MKNSLFRFSPLLLGALVSACTTHQNERLQECFAPPQGAFELRNRNFALDTLAYRSNDTLEIALDPVPLLSSSQGSPVYFLKANGLPTNERFLLTSFDPLKHIATPQFEFEVLENNTLQIFTAKETETVNEAAFVLKDLLHGQPIELAILSKDKNTYSRTRFIPNPFEASIEDANFSLSVIHRKGTHFLLQGQGLLPGELVEITEHSGPQTTQHLLLADRQGSLSVPIDPIILGRLGGAAQVTIARRGGEARIDYFWGGRLELESKKTSHFHPLVFIANRDAQDLNFLALQGKIDQKMYL